MKRDMKLVRMILEAIEASPLKGCRPSFAEVSHEIVAYHLHIMAGAGFVTSNVNDFHSLTMKGHDYLEELRFEERENEAKFP